MFRLVVLSVFACACAQQYGGDPRTAAIVQEARYLNGNGAFGAAYKQEDGIDFKEETDADGNRRGSYSYIDPSGERKTVNYVAGKNGFQASGDHIPTAPQAAAPTPGYQPDPRYQSPEYRAPVQPQPQQQYSQQPAAPRYATRPNEDDGQYYPELYEQENYVSQPQPTQPRYQPAQQQQYQPAQQQQYQPAPQPQYQSAPQPQYQPQQATYTSIYPGTQQAQYSGLGAQQAPVQAPSQQRQYYEPTTPPTARFHPPGKFSLNRAPDGYTYSFQKV